jgi:hypothetical protein
MDILQLCTNLVDFQTNLDIKYIFFLWYCSVAQKPLNTLHLYMPFTTLEESRSHNR